MSEIAVQPGQLVAGRYRIEEAIGQGGFGAVYRATELKLDRAVALKILLPTVVINPKSVERFRREVELAKTLEHPNTVRLYDVGETEQGLPFISWEFLRGSSLEEVVLRDGAMTPARVARIGSQLLKSLMEAHGCGIVHRDIKPANVLLCNFAGEPDFVKVLDFGVAKVAARDGQGTLTQDGHAVGTPSYMAPEQVLGEEVDARSDLYAVGLTLAEMLCGLRIYCDDSAMKTCMAQASRQPVPLPAEVTGSAIGPVIARATNKIAAERYASAAEMLAALESAAAGLSAPPLIATAPTAPLPLSAPQQTPTDVARALGSAPTIGTGAEANPNVGHAATIPTPMPQTPALSSGSQLVPPAVVGQTGQPLVVTSGPSLGKIALLVGGMMVAFIGIIGGLLYLGVLTGPDPKASAQPDAEVSAQPAAEVSAVAAASQQPAASASVTLPSGPAEERSKVPSSHADWTMRGTSAQAMLDALADDGWTVALLPQNDRLAIEVVTAVISHGRTAHGSIQFHTYEDAPTAKLSVTALREDAAVQHDGPRLIYLHLRMGGIKNVPTAYALLERLLAKGSGAPG